MPNIKIFSRPRSHELGHLKLPMACSWTSAAAQTEVTAASTASHGRTPRTWHGMEGLWGAKKRYTNIHTKVSKQRDRWYRWFPLFSTPSLLRTSRNRLNFTSIYLTNTCPKALISMPWQSLQAQTVLSPAHSARSHLADLLQLHTNRQPCRHGAALPRAWKAVPGPWAFLGGNPVLGMKVLVFSLMFWHLRYLRQMVQQCTRIESEWTREYGDPQWALSYLVLADAEPTHCRCKHWTLGSWMTGWPKYLPITPLQMWKTCSKFIQYYVLKCPK